MSATEIEIRKNPRKMLQGVIVSDKMMKTRVVSVEWTKKHTKYHKIFKTASKFKAHDENNETKSGDIVKIMETRPLSKDKRWIIREVVRKA